jgi:3-oxoacyl-[acyl-carrier protein] reductase
MSDRTARVAIVTGSGRGIGAATAARLAADGMAVAVLDQDRALAEATAGKIEAVGGTAIPVQADVAEPGQVAKAVATVAAELGPPTVLVNNAGVTRDRPFCDLTVDDWDIVANVNLRGPFLMAQQVRLHQAEAGWGRIVNLSSVAALGTRNQANYCAAKAGIHGLTKALAIELGPEGITVNAVAPGYIATDLTASAAERLGVKFENVQRVVAAQTPLRRVGQPADIAGLIAFLASDDSSFITGQVISVAGGLMG